MNLRMQILNEQLHPQPGPYLLTNIQMREGPFEKSTYGLHTSAPITITNFAETQATTASAAHDSKPGNRRGQGGTCGGFRGTFNQ